ncbi:hypothetical protein [Candidatus Thiosymbion oneisti]|uniref:hypothetical protein n=1 Tax=Candidatus Thiosymbion oneisti TaxID=589554 RepID=UPI0010605F02|nr:hypothetical protein [Candidatus Thiosymbion oneisti]
MMVEFLVQLFRSGPAAKLLLKAYQISRELEPISVKFFVGMRLRGLFPVGDDVFFDKDREFQHHMQGWFPRPVSP